MITWMLHVHVTLLCKFVLQLVTHFFAIEKENLTFIFIKYHEQEFGSNIHIEDLETRREEVYHTRVVASCFSSTTEQKHLRITYGIHNFIAMCLILLIYGCTLLYNSFLPINGCPPYIVYAVGNKDVRKQILLSVGRGFSILRLTTYVTYYQ